MQASGLPVFPLPLKKGSIQTEVLMKMDIVVAEKLIELDKKIREKLGKTIEVKREVLSQPE